MINRHPLNTNLSLHHTGSWHGYEVQLQHGPLVHEYLYRFKETLDCSGLMNPDTNIGGKVTTLIEVPDDQKTTFLYS